MSRLFWIPVLLLAACGSARRQPAGIAGASGESGKDEKAYLPAPTKNMLPGGGLHVTARGTKFLSMIEDLAKADVVYLGESHPNPDHHLVQLRVIEYLFDRGRLHAIGMEMFQRRFQPVLDDFIAGRIDEAAMLAGTEYKKRWGWDYALYRPIIEFARANRIPLVALNVEREITKAVRDGGLDALDEAARQSLPAIDLDDKEHRQFLKRIYASHPIPEGKVKGDEDFELFYLSQCLWEDVMADSVVKWSRVAPANAQIVVLAGRGHIRYRYGIPARVHRRMGKQYRVVVAVEKNVQPFAGRIFDRKYADYVWITPNFVQEKRDG